MRIIKANKIFDGEKFIEDDIAVVIEGNKIVELTKEYGNDVERYNGILLPGFINAHCHLELSYLQNQFVHQRGMVFFLKQMIEKKNLYDREFIIQKASEWDERMWENGIAEVGDIINIVDTLEVKIKSKINYFNFIEIFGLSKNRADAIFESAKQILYKFKSNSLRVNIVPHSPYSLSSPLWQKYFNFEDIKVEKISSFHFMESYSEKEFIKKGYSEMSEYFSKDLGYKKEEYNHVYQNFLSNLDKYLKKDEKIIFVHNTYLSEEDMTILNDYLGKIYFCLCPKANLFIEGKLPNVLMMRQYSDNICIGTDSLASNDELDIVDEMNTLLDYIPELRIEDVLRWATSNGSKALNSQDKYGYIKKDYLIPLNVIKIENRKINHVCVIS